MGWSEEDQQFNLSVSLEGAAGQILWDAGPRPTVQETIRLLRNRFGNVNQAERFRADLRARKRKPGESLQQLYQDVCRLMSLAYPGPTSELSNIVARDAFLEALDDSSIRVRILEKEPPDLDTALKIACRLEAFDKGSSATGRTEGTSDRPQRSKEKYSRVVAESDEKSSGIGLDTTIFKQFHEGLRDCLSQMAACRKEMEDFRRQVKTEESKGGQSSLNVTGSRGHYGRSFQDATQATPASRLPSQPAINDAVPKSTENESTSKLRGPCHRCGEEGHWARSCPHRKKGSGVNWSVAQEEEKGAQREPRVQVVGEKEKKKAAYLAIDYDGRKICAVLDTGCEVSIVGRRILPADVELAPSVKQLFAANRTKIPLLGSMDMEFEVQGEKYSVTLAVTDAVDEMILGIDWLTQNTAEWDFGRGELTLRGRRVPLQKRPITNRVRRVYSADTVHIPPMTQADIPVKVTWPTLNPEESDWLVEPVAVDEGLIVARTLVSGEALDTAVRVINVSG